MDYLGRTTYGEATLEGFLPRSIKEEGRLIPLTMPQGAPAIERPWDDLKASLEMPSEPPGGRGLGNYLRQDYRQGLVVIMVDDHTRPNAHTRLFLPWLLDWLLSQGVKRGVIHILTAGGTHRPPRLQEWGRILGQGVWEAWSDRTAVHDCDRNVEAVGTMADGTPVEINRLALEAEVLIPLTDLDYHYFAGVSGGPKQLIPGIAGRRIITAEHLQMFDHRGFRPGVDMGSVEGNPVYEYKMKTMGILLRALAARGTTLYALTTVMDPRQRPVHVAGGDVVATHHRARQVLDAVYVARIPRLADVIIMGARHLGLNLYQAGKAFNAARRAVRPGGEILVVAPCNDAWGNDAFRELMGYALPYLKSLRGLPPGRSVQAVALVDQALEAVQAEAMRNFVIGKQKPVDLLTTLRHVGWGHLWLMTEGFPEAEAEGIPMGLVPPGKDPSMALRRWVEEREAKGSPSYLVVDDPSLLIQVEGPGA